jgi:hypothetical protein
MKIKLILIQFISVLILINFAACEKSNSEKENPKYEEFTEYTILKGNHISQNYEKQNTPLDLNFSFAFGDGCIYDPIDWQEFPYDRQLNILLGFTSNDSIKNSALLLWESDGDSISFAVLTRSFYQWQLRGSMFGKTSLGITNKGRIWYDGVYFKISLNDEILIYDSTTINSTFTLNTPMFGSVFNSKNDTTGLNPAPKDMRIYIKYH